MREAIHPEYHKVSAVCVCGGTIETGSTLSEIRLDICSACHPFYTGTQNIVDTEGRVDKFKKRYANAAPPGAKKEKAPKKDRREQATATLAVAEPVAAAESPVAEAAPEAPAAEAAPEAPANEEA